jgi:hypothetical protein
MLENIEQGYNATVFAYGQAGSGKSYTIMGDRANKGKLHDCDKVESDIDSI